MSFRQINDLVMRIAKLARKKNLSDVEVDNLSQVLSVVIAEVGNDSRFFVRPMATALAAILENPRLSTCHADSIWIVYNMLNNCTDFESYGQLDESGIIEILISWVLDDSTPPLRTSVLKLNCLRCISRAAKASALVRDLIISSGLIQKLAHEYLEGNIDGEIQDPAYKKGDGNIVLQYCRLLQEFCKEPDLEDSLECVIWVLVDVLKKSSELEIVKCCLFGISRFSASEIASLESFPYLHQRLMEVLPLAENEWFDSGAEFFKSFFGVVNVIVQTGMSRDLLENIQLAYQRFARSFSQKSKRIAQEMASAAHYYKLDIVGHGSSHVSFCTGTILYYDQHFRKYASLEHQVGEVVQLICEFAAETYRMHQMVDVLDKWKNWCAAEIMDIEDDRLDIRFTGSPPMDGRTIRVPYEVAPAFTYTRLNDVGDLPVIRNLDFSESLVQGLLSCKELGLTSPDEVWDMFTRFGNHIQDVINYARWANRENLKGLL
eukprot:TRINITY_DN10176_c0_g1_i11.p1 TRINITY_DN10176_c0_g1~~TRINITY_DN10176_c0_g1_i11.p1  ORF type:complete len:490 (-),score=100.82 TRINITY_DN10176_c0_g1_i11:48-1517(-)